jgi:hypothetical protein
MALYALTFSLAESLKTARGIIPANCKASSARDMILNVSAAVGSRTAQVQTRAFAMFPSSTGMDMTVMTSFAILASRA